MTLQLGRHPLDRCSQIAVIAQSYYGNWSATVDDAPVPLLRANVAFVRAWRADGAGNLVYRLTEQNFNRAMATAADLVVAEVERIVPVGELAPEAMEALIRANGRVPRQRTTLYADAPPEPLGGNERCA